jgi:acetylornithine deacetylase/succinyl-diaminopimelate desuccinylase-like protein
VYAIVPNATATNAKATMAIIADGNSATLVGVGVADMEGNVIPLLVGTQIASMAAPLEVGT